MIGPRDFYEEAELAKLRRDVVAFWFGCVGVHECEIARRLRLSVSELQYIFAEQLEDGPIPDADAILALYARAIGGDAEAALVWLAAAWWDRKPFQEILVMPGRARWV